MLLAKYNFPSTVGIVGIVAGNGGHVMALSKNGVVYSWGNNKYNNIDGTMDTVTRPQKLSFSHSVTKIAIGACHTLFLLQNRQVHILIQFLRE